MSIQSRASLWTVNSNKNLTKCQTKILKRRRRRKRKKEGKVRRGEEREEKEKGGAERALSSSKIKLQFLPTKQATYLHVYFFPFNYQISL